MSNFIARPYLPPHIQRFFLRLIDQIIQVLQWHDVYVPPSLEAATHVLDVLRDWLPLGAGFGFLRIETKGTGTLTILIQDSKITISFVATLPFGLPMEPITVFELNDGGPQLSDRERVRFAFLLLRRATWGRWTHDPEVKVEAEWTWATDLRPSPKWVAWREEAVKAGLKPPTADHWLADNPQSSSERA